MSALERAPEAPIGPWVKLAAGTVAALTVLFAAVFAAGSIALVDGVSASRHATLDAPVEAGSTVTVNAAGAAVRVITGPAGAVSVDDRLDVRMPTRSLARLALDGFRPVSVTQQPGTVTLTVPPAEPAHLLGNASLRVTVRVPADVRLVVHASAAGVSLDGVGGDVEIDAAAAGVALKHADVTGTIHVRTAGGAISVDGRMAGGTLDLETTTGAIAVLLPADASATYEVGTATGSVVVSEGRQSTRQQVGFGRSLTGRLGDGSGGAIRLRTTTGAIVLATR